MHHWIGSPPVEISVVLRDDTTVCHSQNHKTTFRGCEPIIGKARFSSKNTPNGIRCKVIVLGNVEVKIIDNANHTLSSNASYETYTFLSYTLCECDNTHTSTDIELPFVFTLPNLPRSSYRTSGGAISQQILPAVHSKHASRRWLDAFKSGSTAHYRITYTVTASALAGKKVISTAAKNFHYVPVTQSPNTLAVEDFPEEYIPRATKLQQRRTSVSRLGFISQEPSPLMVSTGTRQASTNIELLLMLARRQPTNECSRPKTFSVRAQFRTMTFVMRKPGTPAMHTVNSESDNLPIIRQEKAGVQSYSGKLELWKFRDSSSESDDDSRGCEEISTNTIKMPFSVGVDSHFAPGFWSPLLSRRHIIDLTVTLDDDPSSMIKLRLPIQV